MKYYCILIITRSTHFHFKSGGMETQQKVLAEGLADLGYKVLVLTTALPREYRYAKGSYNNTKQVIESNVQYEFIDDTPFGYNSANVYESFLYLIYRVVFQKFFYWDFRKHSKKNYFKEVKSIVDENQKDFDLIISQSTAGRFLKSLNMPLISIIHGTIKAELKNKLVRNVRIKSWIRYLILDVPSMINDHFTDRVFYREVNIIVAVSNALKFDFLKLYPKLRGKIKVIYNGVDEKRFKPTVEKFSVFTLLYVGRIEKEKGVDIIISALDNLVNVKKININMIFVGSGDYLEQLKVDVKEKKLSAYISFEGELPNSQVTQYYQKSHIFVLPTRRVEGHPMTACEAMCSGLPIIATSKGGLKNVIKDGINGLLVYENDPPDLVDKIQRIYNDVKLLERLSSNARNIGLKQYSSETMIKRYDKLINQLLNNSKND